MICIPPRLAIRRLAPAFEAALLLALTGCTELPDDIGVRRHRPVPTAGRPLVAYWHDDPTAKGVPRILINLTIQQAFFFRGDLLVGKTTISSGRRELETPPGQYRVIQKDKDHVSSEYGVYVSRSGRVVKHDVDRNRDSPPSGSHFVGASMPCFMRFTGGYGMHAGVVPNFRASHGCVRLPAEMAQHFFDAAKIGTSVEVVEPGAKLEG